MIIYVSLFIKCYICSNLYIELYFKTYCQYNIDLYLLYDIDTIY